MMTPLQTLKALRLMYGTPMTPEENGALLNATAWLHRAEGYGVYYKPAGNNCPMPNGLLISRDILYNKTTGIGYDCLQDSEGAGVPVWVEAHGLKIENWTAPIDPGGVIEPPVPPTPIPPQPPVEVPQPPVTSYSQFLNVEMPMLLAAYEKKHNQVPAFSDAHHLAYRRLVERWTLADMVKDI